MKSMILLLALASPLAVAAATPGKSPTAAEVDAYIADAEGQLQRMSQPWQQAQWVSETFITDDTAAIAARIDAEHTALQVRLAKGAAKYDGVHGLSPDTRRKLDLLKLTITLPAPDTPGAGDELSAISTRLQGRYGKGKGTLRGQPINGSDIEKAMGTNRNPAELTEMWTSWHDKVGGPMRSDYAKLVAIANRGAVQLGYKDVGEMWRSGYDMSPAQFAAMVDRLWAQVKPLYEQLHCFTRAKLNQRYGDAVQPASGPIRADLLGNMWAQEWGDIYEIVAPKGVGEIGYEIGPLLTAKGYDPIRMFKTGEGFYTSLGFAPLPASFWERSQITKPRDREVVCHASAWDVDDVEDLRIKMCTKVVSGDFIVIHHEMGHNFYQRAYNKQPFLYRDGANDGFHEAIGDFIALSVTPDYLVKLGLLDPAKVPGADKDIGLLLRQAMDKIAFLPFGYAVDKWRWDVFSGAVTPANYNKAWHDLRLRYQGIVPPVARDETGFDPGAKMHVAFSTPYARYFLARILQFQFYKAACDQAGWKGPLHRCSFYGDKAVGQRLNAMLAMGHSRPWPDALQAFTGTREIDAGAMLAYFAPLTAWLQAQNRDRRCGW